MKLNVRVGDRLLWADPFWVDIIGLAQGKPGSFVVSLGRRQKVITNSGSKKLAHRFLLCRP